MITKGRKYKKLLKIKNDHIAALTNQEKSRRRRRVASIDVKKDVEDIRDMVNLPPKKKDDWSAFEEEIPFSVKDDKNIH